ncbi:MAG: hypothetical protein M3Q38_00040 [Chloroflexota bacterium]|nr:hypothetical protein [Chloroflexota bacterium]
MPLQPHSASQNERRPGSVASICISVLCRLGAPAGQKPAFYKDFVLALISIPTYLIAVSLAAESKFTAVFWASIAIAGLCTIAATKKWFIIAAVLLVATARFGIALVLDFSGAALAGALVCALALRVIIAVGDNDY